MTLSKSLQTPHALRPLGAGARVDARPADLSAPDAAVLFRAARP